MHSRIFVYKQNKKIDECDINEDSFYDHWFINNIVDYILNSNLTEDIKWLKSALDFSPIEVDINNKYLIAHGDFKKEYFQKQYDGYIRLLEKMSDEITLDKFSDYDIKVLNDICQLNNLYNDKYSFYFCNEDMEILTMDEFVRKIKIDCKYYIVKTFDYHI